jgi:hypothetical protein
MNVLSFRRSAALLLAFASFGCFTQLQAQAAASSSSSATQSTTSLASLPPALRAAIMSGSSAGIQAALTTLSGGNPVRLATLASQVADVAQGMISTNPAGAAQAAAAALQAVNTSAVMAASPSLAMQVAQAASRVAIAPAVQAATPLLASQIAVNAARVVTNPTVFQLSPSAAIAVMSESYSTVSSPAVIVAAPSAPTALVGIFAQAVSTPSLLQMYPSLAQDVSLITKAPANVVGVNTPQDNTATPSKEQASPVVTPLVDTGLLGVSSAGI